MIRITRAQLREWRACYSDEEIAVHVPPEGLTPLEVAARRDVPAVDRLWVLLREDFLSAKDLRLLACKWARAASQATQWYDAKFLRALALTEQYARGDIGKEGLSQAQALKVDAASNDVVWAAWTSAAWAQASGALDRKGQILDVVQCLKAL